MITGVAGVGRWVLVRPARNDAFSGPIWRPGLGKYEAPVLGAVAAAGPAANAVFPFPPGMNVFIAKYAGTAFELRRTDGSPDVLYAVDVDDVLALWANGYVIPIGDRLLVDPVPMAEVENRSETLKIVDRRGFAGMHAGRVVRTSARAPAREGALVLFPAVCGQVIDLSGRTQRLLDYSDVAVEVTGG